MRRSGLSGLGVGMVAAGAFLIFAGITDTPLLEGARNLARGRDPATGAPSPSAPRSNLTAAQRREAARRANR